MIIWAWPLLLSAGYWILARLGKVPWSSLLNAALLFVAIVLAGIGIWRTGVPKKKKYRAVNLTPDDEEVESDFHYPKVLARLRKHDEGTVPSQGSEQLPGNEDPVIAGLKQKLANLLAKRERLAATPESPGHDSAANKRRNERFIEEVRAEIKRLEPKQALAKPTQKKAKSKDTRKEIVDAICHKLNELAHLGDLMLPCMGSLQLPHDIELQLNRWSETCEEFLNTSLGKEAVAWFRSPTITPYSPIPPSSYLAPLTDPFWHERQLHERVFSRVMRLKEIIEKVETGVFAPY